MNVITKTVSLPDGRTISIETGKVAKQCDGSCMLRMGNTVLLATVCAAKDAVPGTDFMPLQVDYREQYAAAGRFPGGFTKREGKASDNEILTSRLVDRVLRPLFPSNYHAEVYVNVMLFSADGVDQPDALAGFAASTALACSDIPFECPISEVRVARVNGEYVINPTFDQMKDADMDIMVGASADNIMMVEGEMKEVSEQDMIGALKAAMDAIKPMCEMQVELSKELGKDVKREYDHEVNDEELRADVKAKCYQGCYDIAKSGNKNKHEREAAFEAVQQAYIDALPEEKKEDEEWLGMIARYFHDVEREAMRRCVLDEGTRLDGRALNEVRPIWIEPDYIPGPHGSAIFTRGETQALVTCTLGTKLDEKMIDDVLRNGYDKFLLHYNFPPFSTGEAKAQRGVGRREIGHGHLAWRAVKGMIPADFPYTVRVVSDILESNGSSSMASTCGATLSMRDAGIPMIRPVSGIAMGLIKDEDGPKYAVLSDILGDEDHLGDMDFKVTGTEKGITATQMNIKCNGLSYEILEKALQQAKEGRHHILQCMLEAQPEARHDLKDHAPRLVALDVDKEFIGAIIGKGGETIQGIQEETGAQITIDEIDGKGHVVIASSNKAAIDAALDKIKAIVAIPEEGEIYTGPVKNIQTFGAFVEFMPGKDGLLHISEIDWKRYETMEETGLKEGDIVTVKLIEIDKKTGKFRLSAKALKEKPEGYEEARPRREGNGGPRREFNDRPRRDGNDRPRRDNRPRREGNDFRGGER